MCASLSPPQKKKKKRQQEMNGRTFPPNPRKRGKSQPQNPRTNSTFIQKNCFWRGRRSFTSNLNSPGSSHVGSFPTKIRKKEKKKKRKRLARDVPWPHLSALLMNCTDTDCWAQNRCAHGRVVASRLRQYVIVMVLRHSNEVMRMVLPPICGNLYDSTVRKRMARRHF